MTLVLVVRHGQASFGADDYDQLSPLGRRQAVRLGEYFRAKGMRFEAALVGTLNRHAQTFDGIAEGLRELIGDQARRARLAAAGKERAQQFPWEASARVHLSVYAAAAAAAARV